MPRLTIASLGLLLHLSQLILAAADWPQWRGPNFDGSSPETGLPETFSPAENVKWAVALPGAAGSTPIVSGNRVFVSSADEARKVLLALCLDRRTGQLLWKKEIAQGIAKDRRSNYAGPSPVTDGQRVVFFYGSGELAAFDLEGKKLWDRNIQHDFGPFAFLWTFSSSPLLYQNRLYLQVLQRDVAVANRGRTDGSNDSYLLALDPKTGRELWKRVRPSKARGESREAFTTPIPFTHQGRTEILIAGGDCLTGHDPETGRELWRWGTWNSTRINHWRLVASPVAADGAILVCAPKGGPVYAIKAGGHGLLQDSDLLWKSSTRGVSSDVSTPLAYQHRFYILNSDARHLSCVEPLSGRVLWTGDLGSRAKIEASPTGADGKIYAVNQRGQVFVMAAGDEFKLLHSADFGTESDRTVRSSIAIASGNLYVRTDHQLYCLGD